jgi:hypothetical protein
MLDFSWSSKQIPRKRSVVPLGTGEEVINSGQSGSGQIQSGAGGRSRRDQESDRHYPVGHLQPCITLNYCVLALAMLKGSIASLFPPHRGE